MKDESPRRLARELVLKRLYAAEVGEITPDDVLKDVVEEKSLGKKNLEFAREFFLLVQMMDQNDTNVPSYHSLLFCPSEGVEKARYLIFPIHL